MLPGVRDLRERLEVAVKTTAWSGVAAGAALVMLGFLCAALFLFLQDWKGPIIACLILAGAFLVIILVAVSAVAVVRERRARLERMRMQNSQAAAGQWLRDPMVMTTALQLARTLGLRRAAPVLLLGAFVVGLVLSRAAGKHTYPADRP